MTEDNESIIVKLTRIEGKQDLANEKLETANRINEERHAQIKGQISTIDQRVNSHGDRITGLEGRELTREGERKGITTSTKVIWGGFIALAGLAVGIVALLFGQ